MKSDKSDNSGQEFLTFSLGSEEYGIEISRIREIKGYENVTPVPGVAKFIKGIINLRGIIVPIIDLRIKLGVGEPTYITSTAVIIIDISDKLFGVIVDSVSDVVILAHEHIKPAPEIGGDASEAVKGLGSFDNRMIILIDIEKILLDGKNQLVITSEG